MFRHRRPAREGAIEDKTHLIRNLYLQMRGMLASRPSRKRLSTDLGILAEPISRT